ncbi:hypothetical protein MA16_Dca014427 [Dendrobium catenatum]|uniref:Uncharacterized protein n=1 Tax=Dendrobium catenatum TaxID=906689 RepID=A0A2I0VTU0_9ASPA|nr:hypothetical protein MA16_Dca014427 [Dendrobium catenatum]
MILAAITKLGEKDGSSNWRFQNKLRPLTGTAYRQTTMLCFPNRLPNRRSSASFLLFLKNNYLKPDTDAQPRRGRGCPPKPKPDVPEGPELQSMKQHNLPAKEKNQFLLLLGRSEVGHQSVRIQMVIPFRRLLG